MLPGGALSLGVAFVLLLFAAAKAHGRQVRVERERVGVTAVQFGADNGPVVEAIWRHDRIRFWVSVGVFGLPLVALAAAGVAFTAWPRWGAVLVAAGFAFITGFVGAGLVAWSGQMRERPGDPDWLQRANWASFGWWTLVAAALALVWLAVR